MNILTVLKALCYATVEVEAVLGHEQTVDSLMNTEIINVRAGQKQL